MYTRPFHKMFPLVKASKHASIKISLISFSKFRKCSLYRAVLIIISVWASARMSTIWFSSFLDDDSRYNNIKWFHLIWIWFLLLLIHTHQRTVKVRRYRAEIFEMGSDGHLAAHHVDWGLIVFWIAAQIWRSLRHQGYHFQSLLIYESVPDK